MYAHTYSPWVCRHAHFSEPNTRLFSQTYVIGIHASIPQMHTHRLIHAYMQSMGVMATTFQSSRNKAPIIDPWFSIHKYPSIYGRTELQGVTFAKFGEPCKEGARRWKSDYLIGVNKHSPDAHHPVRVRGIEMVDVGDDNVVKFAELHDGWINQVHVCACMYACMYVYVCMYVTVGSIRYMCVHVCMHVCMYMYACT
jgi:hypothetical protein